MVKTKAKKKEKRIIIRRLRRQRHSIANTSNNNSASDLHPVLFRVERRESVPLRVVETDEADKPDKRRDVFELFYGTDAQTLGDDRR